ncbi:MAG: LytR C-terminal domain-containing protein [Candidatus Pacebacteria bacterium]|nr:LytR C-terminal domain-containing protein [Candidatus Paceibacterota bacterium]
MARRKTARSKSKSPHVFRKILQFFLIILLGIFMLCLAILLFFIIASPKISNKFLVLVPDKKSGGEGQIILAQFFEKTNSVNVIGLNKDIKSELIGGYGEYQLKAVKGILEIDKKGSDYIRSAFSYFLKQGVDEVINYNSSQSFPSNKGELLKLLLVNKETLLDGLVIKDIEDENITFIEIGSKEAWENYLKKQITWKINDQCTVAVVNSTVTSGLASKLGLVLENSGVDVVRSTNSIWGDSATTLFSDDDESCLEVKNRIKSISPIELNEVNDNDKTSQYRANIVLFIGDELAEVFK